MSGVNNEFLAGDKTNWDDFSSKSWFDPIPPDSVIHDGAVLELGGRRLVAHLTPGHTSGFTTWATDVTSGGKSYPALLLCSLSVPGYRLVRRIRTGPSGRNVSTAASVG